MTRVLEGPVHVVELDGTLDVPTAARVRDTILSLGVAELVVVDCRKTRDVQDAALAFLVWSVLGRGRRLELRGIGEHQLRLLRYLGFEEGELRSSGAAGDG